MCITAILHLEHRPLMPALALAEQRQGPGTGKWLAKGTVRNTPQVVRCPLIQQSIQARGNVLVMSHNRINPM